MSADGLAKKVEHAIGTVTQDEVEKKYLTRSKNIDIICFGRAGVGKSTLLEAVTSQDFGSAPSMNHVTKYLSHKVVTVALNSSTLNIRYWDSKGIDSWTGDDVKKLFAELHEKEIKPISALYCTTGCGRVEKEIVKGILKGLKESQTKVNIVITNRYAMSVDQFESQLTESIQILREITGRGYTQNGENLYAFGNCCVSVVNSKRFVSELGSRNQDGIEELMKFIIESLDEEELAEFYLATLKNRDFWTKIEHKVEGIANKLKNGLSKMHITINDLITWIKITIPQALEITERLLGLIAPNKYFQL